MGDGGPISIPPDMTISIAKDGTVSAVSNNTSPGPSNVIGRLKLVNPPETNLIRADDVNVVDAMVTMIALARGFDMQMKLMQNAENNANKASQLLSLS